MPETAKKGSKTTQKTPKAKTEAKGSTTPAKNVLKRKSMLGRPVEYTDDIADEVCWRIAHGEPLVRI